MFAPSGSSPPRGVGADLGEVAALVMAKGISLGRPLELFAETSSTSDLAKDAARAGAAHGTTFVAERQTKGRGRQGRVWLDARGESLLFSVIVRTGCLPSRLPTLSLACGLAVRDAVARFTRPSSTPLIKWPNDVLIDGRKVAGVLVEGIVQGDAVQALVVGVGINVSMRNFPEPIQYIATSIALHADVAPDRARLLADVLEGLDREIPFVAARGVGLIHGRLSQHDALRGKPVKGDEGEGIAEGIDIDGRLLVRAADGTLHPWSGGEVVA